MTVLNTQYLHRVSSTSPFFCSSRIRESLLYSLYSQRKLLMAVAPPFLHTKADIILRSSDGVDFRVITLFLKLASSSFDSIIEQAAQSNQIEGDLPVVPVVENHRVLDIWLRFCYPSTLAEDPPLHEFEDIIPVLEAARKYSLKPLERKVRQALKSHMEKEPLRCFAIAMRAQLDIEVTLAAKYTLRQSLIPESVPEIDLITAKELLILLTYHQRCSKSLQPLGADLSWITSSYPNVNATEYQWIISGSCGCESSSRFLLNGQRPLKWWCDYMEKSLVSLYDKPSGHTVLMGVGDTVRGVRAIGCSRCCSNILVNMTGFAELFSRKVDTLTAKVHLDMLTLTRGWMKQGVSWDKKKGGKGGKKKK